MYRIIDGRATGKTKKLLLLAKGNDAIIACQNPYSMQEKAYSYGITGIDFISYREYTAATNTVRKPVLIDEVELYLKSINSNLLGYTLSTE